MERYSFVRYAILVAYFIEAYVALGVARLLLLWMPFRRIARLFGLQLTEDELRGDLPPPAPAQRVARAIRAAARRTPWESKCLAQALACAWMLRRRGIQGTMYLGLHRAPGDDRSMLAHAWLRTGNTILTGAAGHQQYTVVARFMLAKT